MKCLCGCSEEVSPGSKYVLGHNFRNKDFKEEKAIRQTVRCLNNKYAVKHGMWNNPLYRSWNNMRRRCKSVGYRYWGIKVCPVWENNVSAFIDYVSKLPHCLEPGYSLDRINNDGNYEPGNVRWATSQQQYQNRRIKYRPRHQNATTASSLHDSQVRILISNTFGSSQVVKATDLHSVFKAVRLVAVFDSRPLV